jgi:hypothetical protein
LTCLNEAFDNLAAYTETKIALHARCNDSGEFPIARTARCHNAGSHHRRLRAGIRSGWRASRDREWQQEQSTFGK